MLWCGNELCRFTDWLTLFLGSWYKEEINSCLYTSFVITGWKLIVLYIIYLSSPLCFPSQIIKDFPLESILFFYSFSHLSSQLFKFPFKADIFHISLECGWHDKLGCSTSDSSSYFCYHFEKRTQGSDFFLLFTSWKVTRSKFSVNRRRNEKYSY